MRIHTSEHIEYANVPNLALGFPRGFLRLPPEARQAWLNGSLWSSLRAYEEAPRSEGGICPGAAYRRLSFFSRCAG